MHTKMMKLMKVYHIHVIFALRVKQSTLQGQFHKNNDLKELSRLSIADLIGRDFKQKKIGEGYIPRKFAEDTYSTYD